MTSKRIVLVLAPLLVSSYGILRLVGRADGDYGPGLDWQLAHLAGLAGMVLFVPLVFALGRLLSHTPWRAGVVGVTLVGLACTMVQFGADIVEGLLAEDKAGMQSLSRQFHDIPGVSLAFYDVGPQLFFVGLLTLAILLAVGGRMPWWSPVLLATGILLPLATLDFMPVTALLMLAALWPTTTRDQDAVRDDDPLPRTAPAQRA